MENKRNREEKNEPFGELMRSMNHFFHDKPIKGLLQTMDEFFKNPFPYSSPFQVGMDETDKYYIITAELPGVNREQIHLDILGSYITISVRSVESFTEEDSNKNIVKRRQSMQKSTRTIPLPQPIDESKAKASYQNGLLTIQVPKLKGKQLLIDTYE